LAAALRLFFQFFFDVQFCYVPFFFFETLCSIIGLDGFASFMCGNCAFES
jgi:hypothetical protein